MNLTELSKHKKIGVDFDGTLVEHERSDILQQFIFENYLEKEFYIITFRTHRLLDETETHLLESTDVTGIPLTMGHFAGFHSIPRPLFESWQLATMFRAGGTIILPDHPDVAAFYGWKPQMCLELGCTVLIDDMAPMIETHCTRHGIVCLNPDHF